MGSQEFYICSFTAWYMSSCRCGLVKENGLFLLLFINCMHMLCVLPENCNRYEYIFLHLRISQGRRSCLGAFCIHICKVSSSSDALWLFSRSTKKFSFFLLKFFRRCSTPAIVELRYYWWSDPPLTTKVLIGRFDPADSAIRVDKGQIKDSHISYI